MIAKDNPVPIPPFWGRRVVTDIPLKNLFPFINPDALFSMQWGYKQKGMSEADYERLIADKALPVFEALQRRAADEGLLQPKVVYGYFPVQARWQRCDRLPR